GRARLGVWSVSRSAGAVRAPGGVFSRLGGAVRAHAGSTRERVSGGGGEQRFGGSPGRARVRSRRRDGSGSTGPGARGGLKLVGLDQVGDLDAVVGEHAE